MGINMVYTCDCCGREINPLKSKFVEVQIESHNYNSRLSKNAGCPNVHVYCQDCAPYLHSAISAVPSIKQSFQMEESHAIST